MEDLRIDDEVQKLVIRTVHYTGGRLQASLVLMQALSMSQPRSANGGAMNQRQISDYVRYHMSNALWNFRSRQADSGRLQ